MRILFICPEFNGYEKIIIDELQNKGYDVDSFTYNETEIFNLNLFNKFILLILSKSLKLISRTAFYKVLCFLQCYNNNKIDNALKNRGVCSVYYDRLLVIKGYGITNTMFDSILAKKKVLYQWDSLFFYPYISKIYSSFDFIFTFDKLDSKKGYGNYLPNFYQKYQQYTITKHKLFFIGNYTKERLEILEKVINQCKILGIQWDVKLIYNGYSKRLLAHPLVDNNQVLRTDYRSRFSSSSIIFELSNNGQVGSTQRFYEALGNNKILITEKKTDFSISYCEFFNMDRKDIINISKKKPAFIEDYELGNWLDILLGK